MTPKPRPPLPPGPYLVVGLARSGVAAALALRTRGLTVTGVDAGNADDPALAKAAGRLREAGVEVRLDASGVDLAARARTLIKSPGVPQDAPAITAARSRGLTVLGELEFAWRLIPNEFVAVTGTNGKTTTTEWIGHVHREAGLPVAVAGNVGTAASSLIGRLDDDVTVVCEASSFQLEDAVAFSPEAAVLLNLSPDHLDRHGTYEAYVAAKLRIFANQGNDDVAVGAGEPRGGGPRRVRPAGDRSARARDPRSRDRAGYLWWSEQPIVRVDEIALPGAHNVQNAMATAAACLARGIDPEAVATGLRTFAGVRHRLERVAVQRRRGVDQRLEGDQRREHDRRAGGVRQPDPPDRRRARQATGLLAAGAAGRRALPGGVPDRRGGAASSRTLLAHTGVPVHQAGDLASAVALARGAAVAGEVVLLSPACASFDQYSDFEARGDHFRALVEAA